MPGAYQGPTALWGSQYASSNMVSNPGSGPVGLTSLLNQSTNGTIATRAQIKAADMTVNPDAQLASAQNEALKAQVDKHSARLSTSISTAVSNTRQLLTLLRAGINDPSAESQKAVDSLWNELENLFNAAKKAQAALPEFLGKQEDNMRLYHNASVNDAMMELQGELNLQHKKVNIQHDLILDHQQVYQEYKSRTEAKIKALGELEERVSRLTLDKGLLKTELDNYLKQLDQAKNAQADNARTTAELQKELQKAVSSKQELASENESLRSAVSKLQRDLTNDELLYKTRFEELREVTKARDDGIKAREGLESQIKDLRSRHSLAKKEAEQLKTESDGLQQKFKNLSIEYSAIFAKSNLQAKTLIDKNNKLEALQKENNKLQADVEKLGLEKYKVSGLELSKQDLEKQIDALQLQIEEAEKQNSTIKKDSEAKIKHLEKENDELEIEHNDMLSQAVEYKKNASALKALQDENAKLQATIQELKNKPVSAPVDESAVKALEDRLRESEAQLAEMAAEQSKLNDWKMLAERSYTQYKEILPTYKAAEAIRQASAHKDEEIQKLKVELEKGKMSGAPKGTAVGGDAGYWKGKYETLLATL